jgi:hypothetical protein
MVKFKGWSRRSFFFFVGFHILLHSDFYEPLKFRQAIEIVNKEEPLRALLAVTLTHRFAHSLTLSLRSVKNQSSPALYDIALTHEQNVGQAREYIIRVKRAEAGRKKSPFSFFSSHIFSAQFFERNLSNTTKLWMIRLLIVDFLSPERGRKQESSRRRSIMLGNNSRTLSSLLQHQLILLPPFISPLVCTPIDETEITATKL